MPTLKIGDVAPAFALQDVDDQTLALDSLTDKSALVVIFSCNHCPYVRAWEDRMIQIQADYAPKGVQLVAINANNAASHPADSFDNMKVRAREKGFNFPYLRDEDQSVAKAYGAERTPEVFAFDGERKLRYLGAIDDSYDDPNAVRVSYLRDALDAILGGTTPAIHNTPPMGCTIKWR